MGETQALKPLQPLFVADLFRPLLAELLAVLRALEPNDWLRPTVAGAWRLRDIVAHLIDGDLRKVAAYRDGHPLDPDSTVASERDLANLVNGLNASGVAYAARLSPRLLTDLAEVSGGWAADVIEALPPHGPSLFAVSWAGEAESENWMDTGREYTERWHHQAQIRDAIVIPRLLQPRWMNPLLELSVRALPRTFASVHSPAGTSVALIVEGETAGAWTVVREDDRWQVYSGLSEAPGATVRLSTDDAWRLFYNALPTGAVDTRVWIQGDRGLAEILLQSRSVIL